MEKSENKIMLYSLFSALSFVFLVLCDGAGISVTVFALFQAAFLWFLVPDRKKLIPMLPVLIISLNSLLSANRMWKASNFLLGVALYCLMFVDMDIRDTSADFLVKLIKKIFEPLKYLHIPFARLFKANKEKSALIKRVFKALLITFPAVMMLTAVLASADMVFAKGVGDFFIAVFRLIRFEILLKVIFGLAVGFYLFGLLYSANSEKAPAEEKEVKKCDVIIFGIFLASILLIYTIFVFVQFKYLFAGATLPDGLSYTEYARKGFFEQFFLTGVNILLILITVHCTKSSEGRKGTVIKALCCYLCAVTIILLVSSFYRMRLYYLDDGLTRLRFLVFGFLIFEGIGLLITFFYILKPKFNIIVVYLSLGLVYYLLLNIVPIDYFVAKNQVDRAFRGETNGIAYALSLSYDAAPQIERLLNDRRFGEAIKIHPLESYDDWREVSVRDYILNKYKRYADKPHDWRQYNVSAGKMLEIYNRYS